MPDIPQYETTEPVLYTREGPIAWIAMNRPRFNNAQNSQMTYALDASFRKAVDDDAVKVIVLKGEGKHFSAGHDIGTPGRDLQSSFDRRALVYDHVGKPGAEMLYSREKEVYLGMCQRWRDAPKPTIAMVHGACVAGGLMLAWTCDFIIAAEDAFFQDPVQLMDIPGVEYFAHAFELPPRIAKEFIMMGERMPAPRAYHFGMVNRVVPPDALETETRKMALTLSERGRLGLWLTKQAIHHVEDLRGKRTAIDAHFHMHHFAHAQNDLVKGHSLAGHDSKTMANANKEQAEKSK